MGWLEVIGGMYTYFVILNDYGLKPYTLLGMTSAYGIEPAEGDVYDPLGGVCKGNSNCLIGAETRKINMATNGDGWFDMRLFFYDYEPTAWGDCLFKDSSSFFKESTFVKHNGTKNPISYSTEAIKYA